MFLEAPHIETFNMLRPILSHDNFQISYKFTNKSAKIKRITVVDDSSLRLQRNFKVTNEAREQFQVTTLNYIKQYPEQIETFLRHFDLDFSDDPVIFSDLITYITIQNTSIKVINRAKRRQLDKLLKKVPEQWQTLFILPKITELWCGPTEKLKEKVGKT